MESKRRRPESRGTWDSSAKGVMTYEPSVWKADDYALLRNQSGLKIAAYDLDSTLITTRSRARFPKTATDWRLLNSQVAPKLAELSKLGYVFVIFTNQAGVGNGRIPDDFVRSRVEGVLLALNVDAGVFVATTKDHFRKPGTGMWDLFVQLIGGVAHIDANNSFYVGDAAGRPARPEIPKDFSDSDLRFSINIGLRFQTPEEHFLDKANEAVRVDAISGFDPRALVTSQNHSLIDGTTDMDAVLQELLSPTEAFDDIQQGAATVAGPAPVSGGDDNSGFGKPTVQSMILMHGYPASGKTTFVKRYLTPKGYVWINQDTLHTFSRCTRATRDALAAGKSVVIDNTNPDRNARAKYINIAKGYSDDVKIICLCMSTEQNLAMHLNIIREWESHGAGPYVPIVAFHAHSKRTTQPTIDEKIDRVVDVGFVPRFSSEQERYLFTRLT